MPQHSDARTKTNAAIDRPCLIEDTPRLPCGTWQEALGIAASAGTRVAAPALSASLASLLDLGGPPQLRNERLALLDGQLLSDPASRLLEARHLERPRSLDLDHMPTERRENWRSHDADPAERLHRCIEWRNELCREHPAEFPTLVAGQRVHGKFGSEMRKGFTRGEPAQCFPRRAFGRHEDLAQPVLGGIVALHELRLLAVVSGAQTGLRDRMRTRVVLKHRVDQHEASHLVDFGAHFRPLIELAALRFLHQEFTAHQLVGPGLA